MYFTGALIGFVTFIIIGVFHPIVIKCEYYFSKKVWPCFLIAGMLFLMVSFFIAQTIPAAICGVIGFSCLWSIQELFEQEQRVKKGWFPQNPKKTF